MKRASKQSPPKVMVAIGAGYGFGRDMMAGIISYARAHGPWEFVGQITPVATAKAVLQAPEFDGLIFHYTEAAFGEVVDRVSQPMVSVGGDGAIPGVPHVGSDARAIAAMAFDYLAELGFECYAVYGGQASVRGLRLKAFAELAYGRGFPCRDLGMGSRHAWHRATRNRQWGQEVVRLKRQLAQLETKTAIFTWSTEDARPVIAACNELGIAVPDEVAVLGVDDDEAICELASPPISAVDHGCETIGWEAARTLDRLMRGEPVEMDEIQVPPVRVVVRPSSDTLAIDDPLVVQALQIVRERLDEGIGVDDVLDELGVSRPTLEHRFRHTLGRTVHRQLILARIDRAKSLLQATDLDLAAVSVRCGFSYPSKFSTIFRRETGMSPSVYRASHRMRTGP